MIDLIKFTIDDFDVKYDDRVLSNKQSDSNILSAYEKCNYKNLAKFGTLSFKR